MVFFSLPQECDVIHGHVSANFHLFIWILTSHTYAIRKNLFNPCSKKSLKDKKFFFWEILQLLWTFFSFHNLVTNFLLILLIYLYSIKFWKNVFCFFWVNLDSIPFLLLLLSISVFVVVVEKWVFSHCFRRWEDEIIVVTVLSHHITLHLFIPKISYHNWVS